MSDLPPPFKHYQYRRIISQRKKARIVVEFPKCELRPYVNEECRRNCCKFIKRSEKVVTSHTGKSCKYIAFECGNGSGAQVPLVGHEASQHAGNIACHPTALTSCRTR
jgi:hypothetical protein